jgi:uncharacterized membrane protein YidH (DUF202 family)
MSQESAIEEFVRKLGDNILNPIILLLFALALLYLVWGVVGFIGNAENEEKREVGRQHMIWGVVGMFIMVAVWGIIAILKNSLGIPN